MKTNALKLVVFLYINFSKTIAENKLRVEILNATCSNGCDAYRLDIYGHKSANCPKNNFVSPTEQFVSYGGSLTVPSRKESYEAKIKINDISMYIVAVVQENTYTIVALSCEISRHEWHTSGIIVSTEGKNDRNKRQTFDFTLLIEMECENTSCSGIDCEICHETTSAAKTTLQTTNGTTAIFSSGQNGTSTNEKETVENVSLPLHVPARVTTTGTTSTSSFGQNVTKLSEKQTVATRNVSQLLPTIHISFPNNNNTTLVPVSSTSVFNKTSKTASQSYETTVTTEFTTPHVGNKNDPKKTGLGTIVGIVIGVIMAALLVLLFGCCLHRVWKKKTKTSTVAHKSDPEDVEETNAYVTGKSVFKDDMKQTLIDNKSQELANDIEDQDNSNADENLTTDARDRNHVDKFTKQPNGVLPYDLSHDQMQKCEITKSMSGHSNSNLTDGATHKMPSLEKQGVQNSSTPPDTDSYDSQPRKKLKHKRKKLKKKEESDSMEETQTKSNIPDEDNVVEIDKPHNTSEDKNENNVAFKTKTKVVAPDIGVSEIVKGLGDVEHTSINPTQHKYVNSNEPENIPEQYPGNSHSKLSGQVRNELSSEPTMILQKYCSSDEQKAEKKPVKQHPHKQDLQKDRISNPKTNNLPKTEAFIKEETNFLNTETKTRIDEMNRQNFSSMKILEAGLTDLRGMISEMQRDFKKGQSNDEKHKEITAMFEKLQTQSTDNTRRIENLENRSNQLPLVAGNSDMLLVKSQMDSIQRDISFLKTTSEQLTQVANHKHRKKSKRKKRAQCIEIETEGITYKSGDLDVTVARSPRKLQLPVSYDNVYDPE